MPGPPEPPLGLVLTQTARTVANAFDRALAEHGTSSAAWQVLVLLRSGQWGTQSALADAMGVRAATLTHHLTALERDGLVRRWREDANRRVQRAELTPAGLERFEALRAVAVRHDERVRATLGPDEATELGRLLGKLRAGFADEP